MSNVITRPKSITDETKRKKFKTFSETFNTCSALKYKLKGVDAHYFISCSVFVFNINVEYNTQTLVLHVLWKEGINHNMHPGGYYQTHLKTRIFYFFRPKK